MRSGPIDAYLAAFVARFEITRVPGQPVIDHPGVRGLLAQNNDSPARLLVTDDRAYDALVTLMPGIRVGRISVLAAAPRCVELLNEDRAWIPDTATAMVCRDLESVPTVPLTGALTVRPIARLSGTGAFSSYATVIFVNTEPGWRGRGIGQAMTSVALRAAHSRRATQACLDSSQPGLSIYARLGFETVSTVTRFSRRAAAV